MNRLKLVGSGKDCYGLSILRQSRMGLLRELVLAKKPPEGLVHITAKDHFDFLHNIFWQLVDIPAVFFWEKNDCPLIAVGPKDFFFQPPDGEDPA
jgi:hypothetical protein